MSKSTPYCQQCGRKLPCEPCGTRDARERSELQEWLQDCRSLQEGQSIIVWFIGPNAFARQNLNRLMAEWPGAYSVLEPEEPGDLIGCRIAMRTCDLACNPISEWEVTGTRIQPCDDSFWRVFQILAERGLLP